jgi:hypothetical protein
LKDIGFLFGRKDLKDRCYISERCKDCGNDQPGGRTGIWLRCGEAIIVRDKRTGLVIPASKPEDVERAYRELKGEGVKFSMELTTTSRGKMVC